MKKNLTELVFILDRSGSMSGMEKDTIGGFNSFIEKQKKLEGECVLTTVLFDNRCEVLHNRVCIEGVMPLTDRDYYARGTTALMDAVGISIENVLCAHRYTAKAQRPEKVMFVIMTDGMENASRRYDRKKVRQMIETCKSEYGWEFLFLGANIDAEETAESFGISRNNAVDYHADSEGTRLNYEVISETIAQVRVDKCLRADWKRRIDEDYRNRGGR